MSIFDNIQKKNRMRYDTTLFRILSNYIFQQDLFTLSFFESILHYAIYCGVVLLLHF